uniref:catechol O-methyltransferase n=1 Tax=Eutreptiella gymnastica TaxID=73025 RepID=A0A7S4LMA7_9EUGL
MSLYGDLVARFSPVVYEFRTARQIYTWRNQMKLAQKYKDMKYKVMVPGKYSTLHELCMSDHVEGTPQALLTAMDSMARKDELWMMTLGDHKGKFLQEVIKQHQPKTVVEFGTYCGYSTLCIASCLPPGGHLISIDRDPRYLHVAQDIIRKAGLAHKVTFIRMHALDFRLPPEWRPVDFLFMDHAKKQYYGALRNLEPHFRKGSVVMADDTGIFAKQMEDFLSHIRHSGLYETQEHATLFSNRDDLKDVVQYSVFKGSDPLPDSTSSPTPDAAPGPQT